MAGRYLQGHARTGAVDAPVGLIDLGKKLLGQLEERHRLGGPLTSVVVAETDEGLVTARMLHGRPTVDIQLKNAAAKAAARTVAGFVVSPTASDTRTSNGVNVAPTISWPAIGTNPETFVQVLKKGTPAAYKGFGFSKYKRLFPVGIRQCGNIDWRDQHEKWVISYYGPSARYYAQRMQDPGSPGVGFRPWIIRNGYTMLDISSAAFRALVPALSGTSKIVGACIRHGRLLFVARNAAETTEYVYVVGLSNPDPAHTKTFANLNSLLLIGQRTMLASEYFEAAAHPWLFNCAGTEARCIRMTSPLFGVHLLGTQYEGVLAIAADGFSAAFTMNALGSNLSTTTTATTDSSTGSGAYVNGGLWLHSIDATSVTGGVPYAGNLTVTDTTSITPNQTQFKIAVDYVNELPVYAYAKAGTYSDTSTSTSTNTAYQTDTSYGGSGTNSNSRSLTGTAGLFDPVVGIKTDFADVTIPAPSDGASSSSSGSLALVLPAQSYPSGLGTNGYTSGTFAYTDSGSGSSDYSSFNLIYMDLRQGWIVYEIHRVQTTFSSSTSTSKTLTNIGADTGLTYTTTLVQDVVYSNRVVVQKNTVVLLDDTVTDAAIHTSTPTVHPVLGQTPGFIGSYTTDVPATSDPTILIHMANLASGPGAGPPSGTSSSSSTTNYQDLFNWYPAWLPGGATPNSADDRSYRIDQNICLLTGTWTEYNAQWAFSMGLPRTGARFGFGLLNYPNPEPAERWASGIKDSDLPTLVNGHSEKWVAGANTGLIAPPFDLFFPISVLPPTYA